MQSFVSPFRPVDKEMNRPNPQLIRMKKWMRKSTINFLERNKDVIAAPGFVPLCNKMIVDVMSTGFEVVARDTHFITCRARQILTENLTGDVFQEDDLLKAEKELHAHLESIHEYFDTRITQAELKLEAAGFGPNEIQKLVANYETITVTNQLTQYLDILAKADHYVTLLHYLWVTGELSDSPDEALRVKLNAEREARHHLFGITRASNIHYNNVRRICNGVVERRRAERQAQAERDRKREAARKAKHEEAEAKRQAEITRRREEKRQRRESERKQALEVAQNDMDTLAVANA